MRNELADAGPVQAKCLALTKAFPERAEIATFPFDGSLSQAWQSFGRLLALAPGAMSRALAPVYETPAAGSLEGAQPDALALVPVGYCQQNTILPLKITAGQ